MANILSDTKKQQVIALGQLGWTLRRIEAATSVRRETAGAYLKPAGLAVRPPGRWGHPPANPAKEVSTDPAKPASEVSTDPGPLAPGRPDRPPWPPRPSRAPTASACAPYRELIELALTRGRNAMAIWRDLVDDHGFPAQYASVRRFVVTLRGARTPEAHPVIVTAPGEEGQVDYGDGPMVRHSVTRKYRRTRLFLFTLGYSRKSVRLLTVASSTRRWCELHEESFRRLGGAVKVTVLDNLREGMLTPDIYDPTLNPLYRDVLAHYGVVALPCRVGDPDRKGKVESASSVAKRRPLRAPCVCPMADSTLPLRSGSPTRQGRRRAPSKACASRRSRRRRATSIAGTPAGPTPASTARPSARSPRCSPRSGPRSGRCPSSRFATTCSARAPSISTAASRSTTRTTARPPAGSATRSRSSGTPATSACWIRARDSSCASTDATPRAGATRFTLTIGRRGRRPPR